METGQYRHSGIGETRNFERVISDQFRLNPTNSNLKKYIFRVGQPMSVPVRQTKRVNCNKSMDPKRRPQLSDLQHSAFRVRRSMFNVPPSTKEVGKGWVTETSNAELRTPNLERKSNTSATVVPDRAESCSGGRTLDLGLLTERALYFD